MPASGITEYKSDAPRNFHLDREMSAHMNDFISPKLHARIKFHKSNLFRRDICNKFCKFILFAFAPATLISADIAAAETIYSGEFDYKKFNPSKSYFAPKNKIRMQRLCRTGLRAGTADIEVCEYIKYKNVNDALELNHQKLISQMKMADANLIESGQPAALPHFTEAQKNWIKYRDEFCYGATYEMGEASMKYIYFWECMTKITSERLSQIRNFLKHIDDEG